MNHIPARIVLLTSYVELDHNSRSLWGLIFEDEKYEYFQPMQISSAHTYITGHLIYI